MTNIKLYFSRIFICQVTVYYNRGVLTVSTLYLINTLRCLINGGGGYAFHFVEKYHLVEIFAINERKLKRSILNLLTYKKIKLCYNSLMKHFSLAGP